MKEMWVQSLEGLGKSPGGGHGNPLQYSFLESPMDRGAWWATVHRVANSQTWLTWLSTHMYIVEWCPEGTMLPYAWISRKGLDGESVFNLSLEGWEGNYKSAWKLEKIFVSKEKTSERYEWKWLKYRTAGGWGRMQHREHVRGGWEIRYFIDWLPISPTRT